MSDSPIAAEAVVTVAFGEQKEIVLRPVPCAKVTFKKPDDATGAGVTIAIKLEDGSWCGLDWTTWEPGKPWRSQERQFVPGRLRWRAERYSLEDDAEERRAELIEGELELAAGESREVIVQFPK